MKRKLKIMGETLLEALAVGSGVLSIVCVTRKYAIMTKRLFDK